MTSSEESSLNVISSSLSNISSILTILVIVVVLFLLTFIVHTALRIFNTRRTPPPPRFDHPSAVTVTQGRHSTTTRTTSNCRGLPSKDVSLTLSLDGSHRTSKDSRKSRSSSKKSPVRKSRSSTRKSPVKTSKKSPERRNENLSKETTDNQSKETIDSSRDSHKEIESIKDIPKEVAEKLKMINVGEPSKDTVVPSTPSPAVLDPPSLPPAPPVPSTTSTVPHPPPQAPPSQDSSEKSESSGKSVRVSMSGQTPSIPSNPVVPSPIVTAVSPGVKMESSSTVPTVSTQEVKMPPQFPKEPPGQSVMCGVDTGAAAKSYYAGPLPK